MGITGTNISLKRKIGKRIFCAWLALGIVLTSVDFTVFAQEEQTGAQMEPEMEVSENIEENKETAEEEEVSKDDTVDGKGSENEGDSSEIGEEQNKVENSEGEEIPEESENTDQEIDDEVESPEEDQMEEQDGGSGKESDIGQVDQEEIDQGENPEIEDMDENRNDLGISVTSESDIISGECGDNLIWKLEEGALIISGFGEMKNYGIGIGSNPINYAPWGKYCDTITNLVIEEGVTTIGSGAFYECKNISCELILPESIVKIGRWAFENCSGLHGRLILPNSLITIEEDAFYGCTGFSGDIVIPEQVISIDGHAFDSCKGLCGKIVIGSEVLTICENSFAGCDGISSIVFNGNAVDIKTDAFKDISAKVYTLASSIGWNDISDKSYGGNLKWIWYDEGTAPWDELDISYENIDFLQEIDPPNSNAKIINSVDELASISSGSYVLACDLDLSQVDWISIEPNGDIVFDGQGHVIENNSDYLFGIVTNNCEIKNLGISNTAVEGGGLISQFYNYGNEQKLLLYNCYFIGGLDGIGLVGSVDTCGYISGYIEAMNASSLIDIQSCQSYVEMVGGGGFIGDIFNYGDERLISAYASTSITISNSQSYIDVIKQSESFTGGLLGRVQYNNIGIGGIDFRAIHCVTEGHLQGKSYIGGMIGGDSSNLGFKPIFDNCTTLCRLHAENSNTLGNFIGVAGSATFVNPNFYKYEYPIIGSERNNIVGEDNIYPITYKGDFSPSEGTPFIYSMMETKPTTLNYNFVEYFPSSLDVSFILYYMQFDNPTTYENVKVTIELPDGLSFEEDNIQKVLTKQIEIMDSTEENRKVVLESIKLYTDGHYATDEFQIIVSVAADGYETAAKTTLKIPVRKEINYDFYDIQVYSEFANLFVGENQTCAILPAMVNDDEALKNEKGWNFSIENTDIAEIQEYVETEFGPAARIVGKSAGNTKLHIIHIPTGKSVTLTFGVGKNTLTYDLSDVVHFSENEGIMNYGIFTNNYTSQKVADGYLITFDAYNECSSAGAVEVYDSEGNMKYAYEIKKFDRYQTGVKEVFMDGWNLACSAVNGTIMNITNSMYTQRTPISATVPQGGYIIITNDVTDSVPALVYNTVDVTSWMYKEAKAFTKWEKEEPFKDKAKGKFCNEIISYFLRQKYEDKIWMQFQDKLTKSLKKSASMSIEDGCNLALGLYNNTEAAMHDIDVDMKEEIKNAAIDTGIDIAMDVFNEFSPTGEILETMFGINKALNGMMQVVDINKTIDGTKIRIDVVEDNCKLVSEGVIVESEDGTIPDGTDLVVVDITAEETSRYIIKNLINSSKVKIYNITLYKDKTEIQPNDKIRVKVPLPALYKENQCVIYRVELDGSFTDMGAQYSDGYMMFETEHLSNYILYEKVMYSVSFDGNGASGGNMGMLSHCIEGEEYVLPTNGYQREGYLFKEWNTATDGKGTSHADKAIIKNLAKADGENIILYAQWTLPPKEDVDIGDVRVEDIPEDGIIPQGLWISNITEQIYTGNAIKPVVRVYDYKTLLKEKKDYAISYKNNTKANDAKMAKTAPTITVTGKGNYSGKETQTFVILPKDITEEDVMASEIALKSNGKVQKPVPIVMWNGKKLTNKRDFTVSYPDAGNGVYKENGTYKVVLNGTGNYAGSREVMLTITSSKLIPKLKIDKIADQPYTGNKIIPKPVVKDGKNILTENVHYTVEYKNNTEIGKATVIITGIGEYVGVKQTTFKIKAVASLNKAKVILTTNSGSNYTGSVYTGKEIKPDGFTLTITVKNKEKQNTIITLKEGTDYKVSYQNNIDVGTATILFTGINQYTGAIKKKYKITAYDIKADDKNIKVSLNNSYSYTKGGCKPKPTVTFAGTELEEGTDYTLSYKNNSSVNNGSNQSKMPTVIVKGKRNFKGSLTKTYQISNAEIDNLALIAMDKVWQNKADNYKTKITIKDVNGKALSAGKDYDKNIVYTYDAMTTLADGTVKKAGTIVDVKDIIPVDTVIRVTTSANKNGNYHGTVSGTFRITKADISKSLVKIPTQTYTGKAIEPDDEIEIKLNKKSLSKENYEVVEYSNNINKGTATVTIKGKNDCGGTKTVKFKIKQKGFLWWWRH